MEKNPKYYDSVNAMNACLVGCLRFFWQEINTPSAMFWQRHTRKFSLKPYICVSHS